MSARKPILGLALGSGAARGMAHIGVLHALAEAGLSLGVIAGASIGALVGGVYAAGRLQKFADVMSGLDWRKSARFFLEASFARSGLIEGTRVIEFLVQILGPHRIEDLHIAFAAVATDLMSGREVILSEGDLIEAIRASIAVPGIFTPVKRRDGLLADGGLVNPVPVSVCRALGADRVIAVDLNFGRLASPRRARTADPANPSRPVPESRKASAQKVFDWMEHNLRRLDTKIPDALKEWKKRRQGPNLFEVLGNALAIMESQIAEARLKINPPNLLIRPRVGHIRFLEFHRAREAIEEGYRAAQEALEAVRRAGVLSV